MSISSVCFSSRPYVGIANLCQLLRLLRYHWVSDTVTVNILRIYSINSFSTLYSMAKFAGLRDPITSDFENSTVAYCVDAFSISMGALMGTSPVTAFVESATGISEGGKTGIAAIVTGLMFLVSVFFAPIFASIPPWATGSALVIVGSLMIRK